MTIPRPFSLSRRRHRNRTGAKQRTDGATAGPDIHISRLNASEITAPPPSHHLHGWCDVLAPPKGHMTSCCQEPLTSRDILCKFRLETLLHNCVSTPAKSAGASLEPREKRPAGGGGRSGRVEHLPQSHLVCWRPRIIRNLNEQ